MNHFFKYIFFYKKNWFVGVLLFTASIQSWKPEPTLVPGVFDLIFITIFKVQLGASIFLQSSCPKWILCKSLRPQLPIGLPASSEVLVSPGATAENF